MASKNSNFQLMFTYRAKNMYSKIIAIVFLFLFAVASAFAQTAAILPQPLTQFLDNNANPLSSGTVDTYIAGTSTRKTTWQDAGETIPNTNPVVLNAGGRAIIYGQGVYRLVVKDRLGNLIYDGLSSNGAGSSGVIGDGQAVGSIKPWAGISIPNQYLLSYGQELSRVTYVDLYNAITLNTNVICASGSPTLSGISDTGVIREGTVIETSCAAIGTTVVSKTTSTVTMSANASISVTTTARFFPFNNGNGTTTFNIPDLRGYTLVARDNMGGPAAGRLPSQFYGANADASGAVGGSSGVVLVPGNLPPYTPTGTVAITDPGHFHFIANSDSGNNPANLSSSNSLMGGGAIGITYGGTAALGYLFGGTATAATQGKTSAATTGITAAFTGTAQGGGSAGFSVVQPSITVNYLIKVLPDSVTSSPFGVASLGGMTGNLLCGSGLVCSSSTVSVDSSITGPIPVTIGGTANALGFVPITGPLPGSLSNFNVFIGQATITNSGQSTATIGTFGPYNIYKDGPLGPGILYGNEIVAGNWYTFGFDQSLNSNAGGWHLTPGQSSSASVPANCAPYIPFNPPFQSGFTSAEGGATGNSGIFTGAGGYQTACLSGGVEFKADQFTVTSPDPSGTITSSNWNVVSIASAAGVIRVTVANTAGLSNGDVVGISNAYNSDKTASNINGIWTLANVTGTTVDLIGSTFDTTHTYSTSFRFGFISTGSLDINPAIGCYHYVPLRVAQFNDADCLFVWGGTTIQSASAAQVYGATQNFVIEPDQTALTAHGVTFIGVEGRGDGGGSRSLFPSLGIARGVFTADISRLCGGGVNSNTKVGILQCDKGAGTISSNIGFWSYNQPIGQPIADVSKGLKIINTPGNETTQIDIYYDSVALQGPVAGAGGNSTTQYQTTTVNNPTPSSVIQRINTANSGINGMRGGDFPLTLGTSYYVLLLKNFLTGSVGGFLTTTLDTTQWGVIGVGYTSGYYAIIGQIRTKPGSAAFDTYIIQNGLAQYTINASETLQPMHCSQQNYRVKILAGGTANNTLTFGATSSYPTDCEITVVNVDPANTKTLAFGGTPSNYTVVASQAAIGQSVGSVFQVLPFQTSTNTKFSAVGASDQSITAGSDVALTFATANFNIGAAYNTGTSLFTTPATGYYMFICRVPYKGSSGDYANVILYKNGSALPATLSRFNVNFDGLNMSVTSFQNLTASDTIGCRVNLHTTNAAVYSTVSEFSGIQLF